MVSGEMVIDLCRAGTIVSVEVSVVKWRRCLITRKLSELPVPFSVSAVNLGAMLEDLQVNRIIGRTYKTYRRSAQCYLTSVIAFGLAVTLQVLFLSSLCILLS